MKKGTLLPADYLYVDPNWKPLLLNFPIITDVTPKELGYGGRDYQVVCFDKFKGKNRTILIAPTGSGKSLIQVFNAAREILESDYKQKQVFVVPQLNIGTGFSQYRHKNLRINGEVYGWEIEANCCQDNAESVKRIREFLLKTHPCKSARANKVLGGCTALVSYAALLAAFGQMTAQEKRQAIKNTSFRLDEIHHICGVMEGVPTNQLGMFSKYVLDHGGSLHLTTATFFRGDQRIILGNEYLKDFEICRVQFLDHFKTLGLRSLSQIYSSYKDAKDLMRQILKSISSEPNECPIVIVPSDGMKFFRNTDKSAWVNQLVEGLEKIYGKDKVLDLVNPIRQQKDKKRLMADKQNFCAVVTCMIGREGTDWPPCSRVYNTVLDANVLQPIQKLGRALRQYEGKIDVKMFNFIEHFNGWDSDSEVIRQRLSDRFNAVIAASMLDDMCYPIIMPTVNTEAEGGSRGVSLEDVYGSRRNELIEDLIRELMSIPIKDRTAEVIDEIIDEIIENFKDYMLEEIDVEVLRDRLRKEVVRILNPGNPNLKLDGIDVDFIRNKGWDKVFREHVTDKSPFVGVAQTKDLEELQQFLGTEWAAKVDELEKIGLENLKKGSSLERFAALQRREYIRLMKGD